MGLTAKALLHPRVREDGTCQVRLRLTAERASVFMDAGFTLAPRHWNPKGALDKANWIRGTERESVEFNGVLMRLLSLAGQLGRQHPDYSAEQARAALLVQVGRAPSTVDPLVASIPTDLVGFADHYVRERERTDKFNTVKFYRETLSSLRRWRGTDLLPLAGLNIEHLRAFYVFLLDSPGIFPGTARDRLVKLSTIVKRAEKLGLIAAPRNPFQDFHLPATGNKRPPVRPSEAERCAILAYDIDLISDKARRPGYRRDLVTRRDVWALQFLLRGSRVGDVVQLRERDVREDRISFAETKTGKLKSMSRTPAINAVLARYPATGNPLAYVLPVLDHTRAYAAEFPTREYQSVLATYLVDRIQWVNYGLAIIAKAAGLPVFTSHSARHLYAERAYGKLKDLRLVQAMLNHSDITTTEKYLKTLGFDALDAATAAVLDDE